MGIDTKQIFDDYFKTLPESKAKKMRGQVDRPELYEYEISLGKSVFDMNSDELFNMMMTFWNNRVSVQNNFVISYSTYTQLISIYRAIWNYYIDNVKVIKNPWYDKNMRGIEAEKRMSQFKKVVTFEDINRVLSDLKKTKDSDRMDYLECLILLLYNGISNTKEIVLISESDIDFRNKLIILPGKTVKLSDRCFDLLRIVHNMKPTSKKYELISYRDSYFKFYVKKRSVDLFDERSIDVVAKSLSKLIDIELRTNGGLDIGSRSIYMLGFYDYIISKVGKERANEIIGSYRDAGTTDDLIGFANDYGIRCGNVTSLRRSLKPFFYNI